ncbi:unnamed protein product, partial [Prorocentrum cordatum]
ARRLKMQASDHPGRLPWRIELHPRRVGEAARSEARGSPSRRRRCAAAAVSLGPIFRHHPLQAMWAASRSTSTIRPTSSSGATVPAPLADEPLLAGGGSFHEFKGGGHARGPRESRAGLRPHSVLEVARGPSKAIFELV